MNADTITTQGDLYLRLQEVMTPEQIQTLAEALHELRQVLQQDLRNAPLSVE